MNPSSEEYPPHHDHLSLLSSLHFHFLSLELDLFWSLKPVRVKDNISKRGLDNNALRTSIQNANVPITNLKCWATPSNKAYWKAFANDETPCENVSFNLERIRSTSMGRWNHYFWKKETCVIFEWAETCLRLAVVITSKSLGALFSSKSLTHPPTR